MGSDFGEAFESSLKMDDRPLSFFGRLGEALDRERRVSFSFRWMSLVIAGVTLGATSVGWLIYDRAKGGDPEDVGESTEGGKGGKGGAGRDAGAKGIVAAYQVARPDLGGRATVDLQGLSAGDLARLDALAKRGQTMAEAMQSATLTDMGSSAKFMVIEQAKESFAVERNREPRLAQPQPFLKDFDQIKSRLDLAVELANFAPNGEAGNFQKIEGLVGALGLNPAVGGGGNGDDHSTHPQLYQKLQDALKKIAAQKEAEGLIALLKVKGEAAPTPEGKTGKAAYEWFEEKQKVAIALEPKFPSADDLQNILHDWNAVDSKNDLSSDFGQRATKHLWPRWLSKRYEERGKGGGSAVVTAPVVPVPVPTPTPPPPPPVEVAKKALPTLYFFKDNGDLAVKIPDGDGLTIWLRTGGLGQAELEMKAYGGMMKMGPGGDYFDKTGGNLKMAIKPPTPPYRLVIKQKEEERMRIFVGVPLGADEVLEKLGVEQRLTAEGKIPGTLPKLAGKPGEEFVWVVKYSGKALGVAKDGEFKVGPDGQVDLGAVRAELQGLLIAREKEASGVEASMIAKVSDNNLVNEKIRALGRSAVVASGLSVPLGVKDVQSRYSYEPQVNYPLKTLKPLGESLLGADPTDLPAVFRQIDELSKEAKRLSPSNKGGTEFENIRSGVNKILIDCMVVKSAVAGLAPSSANQIGALQKKEYLQKIADEIARLKSLPLMNRQLPAGDYPLCIKPSLSWSPSGWGLVPVKTLKVP